jgi:hypothetical protein
LCNVVALVPWQTDETQVPAGAVCLVANLEWSEGMSAG